MIPLYTRVQLLTDRHTAAGATRGMLGYVIEHLPDGKLEVEFSDRDGTTIAQIVVVPDEVAPAPE